MRKFLLLLLFVTISFTLKATNIINNSSCDVCILVTCYNNNCEIVSEQWHVVSAGSSRSVQDCGDCTTYKLVAKIPGRDCEDHSQLPAVTIHPVGFGNCIGFWGGLCPTWFTLAGPSAPFCGVTAQILAGNGTLLIQ